VLAVGAVVIILSACGADEPPRSPAEIAAERSFLGPLPLGAASSTPGSSTPARSSPPTTPTVVAASAGLLDAVGDAYTSGAPEGGRGSAGWPALVAAYLGVRLVNRGVAGTGYLVAAQSTTFGERVAQVIADRPTLVIVWGARIDVSEPSAALQAATKGALHALKAGLPAATVVAIGPAWINGAPPAAYVAARNAEAAGAQAAGALFLDPLAQNWFDGPGLMSTDRVHPTNAGFASAAHFIETDLAADGVVEPS
jgi:hypothetical protein